MFWLQMYPNFGRGGGSSNSIFFPNSTFQKNTFGLDRFPLENLKDFLWKAQNLPIFLILNALPKAKVQYRMQADPHFPKCHIRAYCVCVCARRGVNKNMKFFHFLGYIFLHTERFSLGTEEEIRKLYFDDKIWKNNKDHIPAEIRVLKASFSKDRFWTVHCLSIQLIE